MRDRDRPGPRSRAAIAGVPAIALLLLAVALPSTVGAGFLPRTPTYRQASYRKIGQDRSFKCDLVADLRRPPELVIFGGSRATRFRPSDFTACTGLTAINAATQNFRPEDAWAIAHYLVRRAPRTDLRCFFAVQATTFSDVPLHPGLLYDTRLSRWFPASLVSRQRRLVGISRYRPNLLANKRFSRRGQVLWNGYDARRAGGTTLGEVLRAYIRSTLGKAGDTTPVSQTRSRLYFEKTVKLFNRRGIVPVAVIMPYHPRVVAAFRAVGWENKIDRLRTYLRALQSRCDLRVVDLLDIESFGGDPDGFYDGAHVTVENARRIIRHVVDVAPWSFRRPPKRPPAREFVPAASF